MTEAATAPLAAAHARSSEFRRSWPVVVACLAAAVFAWGFAAFGPSVYLAELHKLRGWPAATITGATTLAFIIGAGLLPWVGAAVERFGARAVLTAGLVLIGTAAIGVSRSTALWQLYGWSVLMGGGWAGASVTAISTTLALYFDGRRGLALSLALTGASAGGFAVAPGLVALSHRHGFEAAVPELALALIIVILPLVWLGIRHPSGPAPHHRNAPVAPRCASRSAALRQRKFWSVAGPFALAIAAQVGVMVVQVSYLLPRLGPGGTSLALIGTSIAGAVGRLAVSTVIDQLPQRPVAAATFAIQAASLALMIVSPDAPAALYAGSIGFGVCMGNVVALPSLIIQREFAASAFAVTLGLSTAVGQIAYALSPALLGLVADLTGGYRASLAVCAALQATAAMLVLRRPVR